ncbi:MAG: hypothetical protein LUI08_01870 [Prevotella sp.]|nr:hypothetical protein [Prevotella sp.]
MKKYIKPAAELKPVELADAVVQQIFSIGSGGSGDNSDPPIEDSGHALGKGNTLWDDLSEW